MFFKFGKLFLLSLAYKKKAKIYQDSLEIKQLEQGLNKKKIII